MRHWLRPVLHPIESLRFLRACAAPWPEDDQ